MRERNQTMSSSPPTSPAAPSQDSSSAQHRQSNSSSSSIVISPDDALSASSTFISFKSSFPQRRLSIKTENSNPVVYRQWTFYTHKPLASNSPSAEANDSNAAQNTPPLICISGLYCNIDSFYELILALSAKGIHIMVLDIPPVDSVREFISQFASFCSMMKIEKAHLLGVECGAFLCQAVADGRPDLVQSLCLINSFVSNDHYVEKNIFPELVLNLSPAFALRKLLKSTLPTHHDMKHVDEAKALQFVKQKIDQTSRKELAARINLMTRSVYSLEEDLFLENDHITLIDALDQTLVGAKQLKDLHEKYPGAKEAYIKFGGDFPQLGNTEELLLHVQVHLRRVSQLDEVTNEEVERDRRSLESGDLSEEDVIARSRSSSIDSNESNDNKEQDAPNEDTTSQGNDVEDTKPEDETEESKEEASTNEEDSTS